MRVLVTRPQPDAATVADALAARGHEAVTCPLLEIQPRVIPEAQRAVLDRSAGLIVTSANAIRALQPQPALQLAPLLEKPLFAVGPATEAAARAAGFLDIRTGAADAEALVGLIADYWTPASGPLLHLCGAEIAGDLTASLAAKGFGVEALIIYDAVLLPALPARAADALGGTIQGVLLFSPRTASHFCALVTEAGREAAAPGLTAFCLSAAVAEAARPLAWQAVRIADRPRTDALLNCLPPPTSPKSARH